MSIIKQLATYDGSAWTTDDIGANASNVSLTTDVAGQNNVQSALSKLCGTSALAASRMVVTDSNHVLTTSTPTPGRALVSAATTGIPTASAVTSTELGYLDGVTSNIQTQINNKADKHNPALYFHFGNSATSSSYPKVDFRIGTDNNENLILAYYPSATESNTFFTLVDSSGNFFPTSISNLVVRKLYSYQYTVAGGGTVYITQTNFGMSTPSGYNIMSPYLWRSGNANCGVIKLTPDSSTETMRIKNFASGSVTATAVLGVVYIRSYSRG